MEENNILAFEAFIIASFSILCYFCEEIARRSTVPIFIGSQQNYFHPHLSKYISYNNQKSQIFNQIKLIRGEYV